MSADVFQSLGSTSGLLVQFALLNSGTKLQLHILSLKKTSFYSLLCACKSQGPADLWAYTESEENIRQIYTYS